MTFKTLMKIRSVIVDKTLEVESQIEELNNEAAEMKKVEGNYYNSETDTYTDQYEYNRKQCSKLRSKLCELKDLIEEIESAELR